MNIEKSLTVGECCCFDLKTGGLIIGYIHLIFSMIPVLSGLADPFTLSFPLTLFLAAIDIGFVYGIHKNQPKYMAVGVLFSLIFAVFCIGILIYSLIGFLAFADLIMWLKSHITQTVNAMSTSDHGKINTADAKAAIDIYSGAAFGILAFLWGLFAFATWIDLYFAKVKYSLYQAMNRSFVITPTQFPPCGMSTVNLP